MDIKEKLKSFIDKQKHVLKSPGSPTPPSEIVTAFDFEGRTAVTANSHRKSSLINDHYLTPEATQAVIESIEPIYFEMGDNDVSEHELGKFPETADIHVIRGMRSRLRKQHNIVSRRVSDLIVRQQSLCTAEMGKVTELQKELCKAVGLCVTGRENLSQGRKQFTTASLGILANYSKRQKVMSVINSLRTIRTLQMTDVQLQSLLKVEDYPGAIQLLLECQKAAATFKHFTCISELSTKLQETLESTEEQLDVALSRVASNFNTSNYEKLQVAYRHLGKTQTLMDQLHMHLTSHIHNSAFMIVLGYVELYTGASSVNSSVSGSSYSKMQYSELCKHVNPESFLPCLLDLSKAMWNVLKSYKSIMTWHEAEERRTSTENSDEEQGENKLGKDDAVSRKYVKQKLEHGLIRIWQDVQAKVRTYILASDLSYFKLDDFLRVLDVVSKLIEVGESFCGSKSESLHGSIKQQSINYFRHQHRARMEELHMFLENEAWEVCPVRTSFTIYQLVEYRFLKTSSGGKDASLYTSPASSPVKRSGGNGIEKLDYFEVYKEDGTPFDLGVDETMEEDIMATGDTLHELNVSDDSDDDIPEELKQDYVDEQTGEPHIQPVRKKIEHSKAPVVTNTTLTILRLCGKYIQMMRLLQPIAFDVTKCLSHLFEYYLYTVFTFFGSRDEFEHPFSAQLRTTLKQIEDSLILMPDAAEEDVDAQDKVPRASISPIADVDSPESLYGLPVRVVAAESLAFLASQLEALQRHIEPLIPSQNKNFLTKFYSSTVKITPEIRNHVYITVAARVVDYESIISQMAAVKWDVSDLRSQHNKYVDNLLMQLQEVSTRLEEIGRECPIPREAYCGLWECIVSITNKKLLEGFSTARRCSNEGRSLMQLDYQNSQGCGISEPG
ncbi:vacuolar protein sorting 50 isoform X2 [Oratosquilla oratoria]|uniref:vacuolar protein sorting 50 isoform X2 n=1 Tax=Oratosquilla oratoria TaxID=337810 RepID=UPI003F774C1C